MNNGILIKKFLNPEGHQNPISGSRVTTILLKGWSLPIAGASAVEGRRSTGLTRLVFNKNEFSAALKAIALEHPCGNIVGRCKTWKCQLKMYGKYFE
jgi:hypothetical protein